MRRKYAVLVVAVSACGTLRKPPEPNRKLEVRVEGELFDSDRGYRFAALPESTASVVRLDVRYPIGSADDPPGKAGLAHLVEHLMFDLQVTTSDGKTSIGEELGRIALAWNATTYADYTNFEVTAAPEALDELIALEVNRMIVGCAGLPRDVFERERDVVVAELRENQGASGAQLERVVTEAVYPVGHPYRQTDSVETVAALTYEDACGFMATAYRHGDVSIVASGAVDRGALQAAAAHYLARAPKRLAALHVAPPRVTPVTGTVHLQADVTEPMVIATWPMPAVGSRDFRLLQTVTITLDDYLGALGYVYGWGHGARLSILGGAAAPVLALSVSLGSLADADDAIAATEKAVYLALHELGGIGGEQDSPEWIARWQGVAETQLARWESLAGRNALVADSLANGQPGETVVKRIEEISKASPREAHDLGVAWLDMDRRHVLVIEPTQQTPLDAASTKGRVFAGHNDIHVDGKLADLPLALPPHAATPAAERYVTANGLHVVMWPHGSTPLVHGRLVVDAGTAYDPVGSEGFASLAGADDVRDDTLTFESRAIAPQVDALVGGLAYELRLPGQNVTDNSLKAIRKALARHEVTEVTAFEEQLLVALYGASHPYARLPITVESTKRITHDSAQNWARAHVVPAGSTLIIAGQFDPDIVKKHILYDTDQLASGKHAPAITAEPARGSNFIRGVIARPTPNVNLHVGYVTGTGIDRDQAYRLVLERVLAASLQRLRTAQAVTYGVSVAYEPRLAGGEWSIGANVDATRAAEAMTSLLAAIEQVRTDPESYREAFVLARQQVLESMLLGGTSSAVVVEQLAELARFHLEGSDFDVIEGQVAKLTLAPFAAFVQRELAKDRQIVGALGNAEHVDEALDAARRATAAPQAVGDALRE